MLCSYIINVYLLIIFLLLSSCPRKILFTTLKARLRVASYSKIISQLIESGINVELFLPLSRFPRKRVKRCCASVTFTAGVDLMKSANTNGALVTLRVVTEKNSSSISKEKS